MSAEPAPVIDSPAASSHDAAYACPNCSTETRGEYCSGCGQKRTHDGDLSLAHAWHHLVHELLHFDGRILQSIKLLFLSPGRLSLDFLEGRRARHVHPVRLFIVFTALFLLVRGDTFTTARMVGPRGKAQMERKAAHEGIPYEELVQKTDRRLERAFKASFIGSVVLTGSWLWFFFRSRRRYLAEHLVVALHTACVSMGICLALLAVIPEAWIFSVWIVPAGAVACGGAYLHRAVTLVYAATARKAGLVSVLCILTSQQLVSGTVLYVQMQSLRL